MKYALLFLIGFDLYPLIELIWRGKTHISMGIVGGICLVLIGKVCGSIMKDLPYILRCMAGAVIITIVELFAGLILNQRLGLNIWSYAEYPFNFQGQICWLYSSFWLLISFPCIWCANAAERIAAIFHNHFLRQVDTDR